MPAEIAQPDVLALPAEPAMPAEPSLPDVLALPAGGCASSRACLRRGRGPGGQRGEGVPLCVRGIYSIIA